MPEERIRAARRAYFGACSYVDAQIGALLATLEECGLADDTIVVFSGDHGDMLGERGLWYKMHWFEMAARVPLLVHAPARFAPRRIGASVSTVDLLPTLVELAGGQVDPRLPLEGRSLLPHLRDGSGHDEVIGEYTAEGTLSPLMMIRRGDYKFIYSEQDPACSTTCATIRRNARTSPPVRPTAERSRRSSTRPGDAGTSRDHPRRTRQPAPPTPGGRRAGARTAGQLGPPAVGRCQPAVHAQPYRPGRSRAPRALPATLSTRAPP